MKSDTVKAMTCLLLLACLLPTADQAATAGAAVDGLVTVSGRVVNARRLPIEGVRVRFTDAREIGDLTAGEAFEPHWLEQTATTDAEGRFSVDVPQPQVDEIGVSSTAGYLLHKRFAAGQFFVGGKYAAIEPGMTLPMTPALDATVRVVDPSGEPIAGVPFESARVTDYAWFPRTPLFSTPPLTADEAPRSDENGILRLPPLPVGREIAIRLGRPDQEGSDGGRPLAEPFPLVHKMPFRGPIEEPLGTMALGYERSVTFDSDIRGVTLQLSASVSNGRAITPDENISAFRRHDFADGPITLAIRSGMLRADASSPTRTAAGGRYAWDAWNATHELVAVPADPTLADPFPTDGDVAVRIIERELGAVYGTIDLPNGIDPTRAMVSFEVTRLDESGEPATASQGHSLYPLLNPTPRPHQTGGVLPGGSSTKPFAFRLPVGRYRLALSGRGVIMSPLFREVTVEPGKAVTPETGADLGHWSGTAIGSFSGQVVDRGGQPIADAVVMPLFESSAGRIALTDADGRFTLQVDRVQADVVLSDKPQYVAFLAIDPNSSQAGIAGVDATQPEQYDRVTVTLSEREPFEAASLVPNRFGFGSERFGQTREKLVGEPAPPIDHVAWLAGTPETTFDRDASGWEAFRGKWVLVDHYFWSCGPCKGEMPELKRIARLIEESDAGDRVAILSIHAPHYPREQAERHLEEEPMPWTVGYQTDKNEHKKWTAAGVEGYPSFFLIDPQGRLAGLPRDGRRNVRLNKTGLIREIIRHRPDSWDDLPGAQPDERGGGK